MAADPNTPALIERLERAFEDWNAPNMARCENGAQAVWDAKDAILAALRAGLECRDAIFARDIEIFGLRAELDAALRAQPDPQVVRALAEWREEDGPVLWWAFPVCEPPYVGTPLDRPREMTARVWIDGKPSYSGHIAAGGWPGYHTHWTRIVVPSLTEAGRAALTLAEDTPNAR